MMAPTIADKYTSGAWFAGPGQPAQGAVWPEPDQELLLRVDHGVLDKRIAALKPRFVLTWAQNQRSFRLLGGILRRLEAAGIETLVLRGPPDPPLLSGRRGPWDGGRRRPGETGALPRSRAGARRRGVAIAYLASRAVRHAVRPLALLLHHWAMFSKGLGRAGALERARGLPDYLRFWANTDRVWKIPGVLAAKSLRVVGHRLGLYRYWDT